MKRHILILAACACACAFAGVMSARLGALRRNDTVVTNVTDVTPGNYETVSNRAMTASNYTDAVAGTLRGKGDLTVYGYGPFIAYSYNGDTLSPPVRMNYTTISYSGGGSGVGWLSESEINGSYVFILDSLREVEYLAKSGDEYIVGSGDTVSASADGKSITSFGNQAVDIRRGSTGMDYPTNNRLATTNDIPRTAGDVGAYPAASGSALESGKQDRLPYPTNAIPFSAIDGAPSGGQEWTISVQDSDFIEFVTNGIARVRWWDYSYTDISDMSAWPDGAAMFVRFEKQQTITSWTVGNRIHLVGYGTWPTNNFQSVWWRSGTNIYVNVILEE